MEITSYVLMDIAIAVAIAYGIIYIVANNRYKKDIMPLDIYQKIYYMIYSVTFGVLILMAVAFILLGMSAFV